MAAKLLLADDSVTIQKVVELTLADEDYDITMVSDGASALRKAEEIQADLILADIVMPELNGYELCEKIRQHPRLAHTPVLLLSSTFETYDEERGKKVGADDHIVKPFESDVLIRKIRTWLEKKSQRAAVAEPSVPAEVEGLPPVEAGSLDRTTGPARVEEEEFDFELTDAFMEEAEEMFETVDEAPPSSIASSEESEEVLEEAVPEEFPGLEEMGVAEPSDEPLTDRTERFRETETLDQSTPESLEEFPNLEEDEAAAVSMHESETGEAPVHGSPHEIDRELMEEEQVNVYEIPEEYAETPELELSQTGAETSDTPFVIEDATETSHTDLIDDFMTTDETAPGPHRMPEQERELTDEEILNAVESGTKASPEETPEQEEATASLPEETEKTFEEVFSMESATDSEWSPELTTYGGNPETVPDEVVEKPFKEEMHTGPTPRVTEETVREMVSELVEKKASEIIERVAWEVIPDLAEALIQKEIQRLQQEVERS